MVDSSNVISQPKQPEATEATPTIPQHGREGAGGAAEVPEAPSTDQTQGMTAASRPYDQEKVEDRGNVSTVTPDDYPRDDPGRPDYR
jgi:hypothetical protein